MNLQLPWLLDQIGSTAFQMSDGMWDGIDGMVGQIGAYTFLNPFRNILRVLT